MKTNMSKPIVITSDMTLFVDVDETLVLFNRSETEMKLNGIIFGYDENSKPVYAVPHLAHIKKIRESKARGHKVIVWSAGGYRWAETVVIALGIQELVDVIMTKPRWYIDDLTASEFLPEVNRIYKEQK